MTLVASPEIITFGDTTHPVTELSLTPETVLAVEFAGSLVMAQQVDMDGQPFTVPEPGKWREDMSTEEWERYIKELERLRKSDAPRQVTMPPYFGTVHSLGEQAAYFALHRFDTSTVAIIPFHATRGADGRESSYFRLYAAQ